MIVVMLAGIGLLAWAGIYNYKERQAAMEHARATHADLTHVDDQSAANQEAAAALGRDLRGSLLPGFTLPSLEGKQVSFAQYKGHPMILNFWATYCGPCKLEMPWFEEFSHKYDAQGLRVLGIDDEEGVTKEDIRNAAKKIGVTYPILLADSRIEKSFGLGDYLPVTYYIDANGKVLAQTAGAPSKDEVEANVRKILGAS
ncbi:MAG: TlpA disulfide reductase family protein [Acidobacteriaceae bacterium]|nr:TlpA disulfide reductase family protein [Acidobacteriaceae bacterium]